jgi:ubiquinol-cytochrome c reductase cytochrome b subunit
VSAADWARSRFGDVRGPISLWMETVSGRPSWARAFGVALVALLLLTALSGVGLSFTYAPSAASAWASVYFTEFVLGSGWFVRSLHVAAAEGAIVIGVVGLVLAAFEGRYRGRRDLAFYMHALMIGIALAFCITGNPLRWDNRGYYGFLVETNIAGELPGGKLIRALALGGSEAGNFTLTRLYALHTLALPLVCAGLLWVWSRSSRAAAEEDAAPRDTGSQLVRDAVATGVTLLAVGVFAYLVRAPLESPADPVATYNARPEWYFSSLYLLRNAVPASMQAIVAGGAPVVVGALVFAVPWLDRDPNAPLARRAPALAALLLPVLGAVVLTLLAVRHDAKDADLQKSHAAAEKTTHRALQVAQVQGIPPAGALSMMRNDPVTRAEDLFRDKCATCHKLGDLGPADGKLTAPTLDGFGTEQWAIAVMENPDAPDLFGNTAYKGRMPSLTKAPTDPALAKDWKPTAKADIDAMAAFLAGEAAESPKSQEGAKLIKQRCTSCHLFRGATDDEAGLGPELAGWGSTAWLRAQIANPGTNATYRASSMSAAMEGHMPRYDADLSADDIDLLARFVRGRGRGKSAQK